MKKGFTLIELLAVIVILAIIALIAVPIVVDIIKDSKESATVRSSELYLKATENAIANKMLKDPTFKMEDGTYSIIDDGNICLGVYSDTCKGDILKVESNNQRPDGGFITIKDGQIVSHSIAFGDRIIKSDDYVEYKGESIENAELTDGAYIHGDYKYTAVTVGGDVNLSDWGGATTLEEARAFAKQMFEADSGMSWEELLEQSGYTEDQIWLEVGLVPETITGWKVDVMDKTKTEYSPILGSINGAPVTDLSNTFKNCTNLKVAPQIPSSVTNLSDTFTNCSSLTGNIILKCNFVGKIDWVSCPLKIKYIHIEGCGHSNEVIPKGANYQTLLKYNWIDEVGMPHDPYLAAQLTVGHPFPLKTELGDIFRYDDYEYCYGYVRKQMSVVTGYDPVEGVDIYSFVYEWPHLMPEPSPSEGRIDGWSYRYIGDDINQSTRLESINGLPVTVKSN